MKKYYVYAHINKAGVVKYIGRGSQWGESNKWKTRSRDFKNRSEEWHLVFPDSDPIIVHLHEDLTLEDSIALEQKEIAKHPKEQLINKSRGPGTLGLEGYWKGKARPEVKNWLHNKGRPSKLKGRPLSEEHRQKLIGKKRTEEAKQRMRLSAKLKPPVSEETRAKLSKAHKGKHNGWKPEDHIKMSLLMTERNKTMWTKEMKEKRIAKIKGVPSKKRKPVFCVSTENSFSCAKEAAESMSLCQKKIQSCCTGKRKTHGGFEWRYL
jgi:hypothetical protein